MVNHLSAGQVVWDATRDGGRPEPTTNVTIVILNYTDTVDIFAHHEAHSGHAIQLPGYTYVRLTIVLFGAGNLVPVIASVIAANLLVSGRQNTYSSQDCKLFLNTHLRIGTNPVDPSTTHCSPLQPKF